VTLEKFESRAQLREIVAIALRLELLPPEHQLRAGNSFVRKERRLRNAIAVEAEEHEMLRLGAGSPITRAVGCKRRRK
jgi:hypothetical protein